MLKLDIINFSTGGEEKIEAPAFTTMREVTFSYDGGRLSVYVQGIEVYSTMFAGNDFSLTMNVEK